MPLTRLQRSTQERATPEVTSQPTIKAFVKVQKRQDAGTNSSEEHKKTESLVKSATVLGKRSRSESVGQCEQERHAPSVTASFKAPSFMPQTPQKSSKYRSYLPSPTPTPSKDRVRSLNCLDDPELVKPLFLKEQGDYKTPPASPKISSTPIGVNKEGGTTLPKELYDLVNLFTSFLKALTLQIAHHGTIAAIDVQELLQSTSKIWRLRTANLNDLRRCLGPLCSPSSNSRWGDVRKLNLQLVRYDRNRTCIELGEADYNAHFCSRLFDHEKLAQIFQENLQKRWESWTSLDDNEQLHDTEKFIQQLPLAALPPPIKNTNPAILKGQQRLEALKSTVEKAGKEVGESKQGHRTCKLDNKSRSQVLLERLKHKEIRNAALPSAPTKSDLERKTSIARLPEIIRILSFSQRAGQRSTQSLSSLVDQIQNSARTPLSRADVERCINILAKEVDCGYVTLLRTGTVIGVVVDHNYTPKDIDAWIEGRLST